MEQHASTTTDWRSLSLSLSYSLLTESVLLSRQHTVRMFTDSSIQVELNSGLCVQSSRQSSRHVLHTHTFGLAKQYWSGGSVQPAAWRTGERTNACALASDATDTMGASFCEIIKCISLHRRTGRRTDWMEDMVCSCVRCSHAGARPSQLSDDEFYVTIITVHF